MFHNLANLNGAHSFARWAGGAPVGYATQLTNTVEIQLNRTDPRDHPQRQILQNGGLTNRGDPYIFEGPSSYRADLAAAAVADAWQLRPNVAYPCQEFTQTRVSIWYRGQLDTGLRNVIRLRILLYDAVPAITFYLQPNEQWDAADTAQETFTCLPEWRQLSASFEMPASADAVTWRWQVSNDTAGAQVIDLGQVWVPDPMYQEAAGGA